MKAAPNFWLWIGGFLVGIGIGIQVGLAVAH